ncbi:MAG: hypothetical protein G01um101430_287 [Parcubacteria group bacterium Gr01-1014_30]|nr:MAG: hypothetical protein G01um101430_287 [Parcubacteria group bacterium Gr01-1014_30]
MSRKHFYYFLVAIFVFVISFPFSGKAVAVCSDVGYTVLTINGIWTDKQGAERNRDALKEAVGRNWNNEPIVFDYLHNPSHLAGGGDVAKAIAQRIIDSRDISDTDLKKILLDASQKLTTKKLFLVGHSQGNFYANSFYGAVAGRESGIAKDSIAVYGVASPSHFVAGDGKHITSDTDEVINFVRSINPPKAALLSGVGAVLTADFTEKFLPEVLPANASTTLQLDDDENGHKFAEIYLKYHAQRIVEEIQEALSRLKSDPAKDSNQPCLLEPEFTLGEKTMMAFFKVADPAFNVAVNATANIVKDAYQAGKAIVNAGSEAVSLVAKYLNLGGAEVGQTLQTTNNQPSISTQDQKTPQTQQQSEGEQFSFTVTQAQDLQGLQLQLNDIAAQIIFLNQRLAGFGQAQVAQAPQLQNAGSISGGVPFTTEASQPPPPPAPQEPENESGGQEQQQQQEEQEQGQEQEQEGGQEDEAEEVWTPTVVINEVAWMGTQAHSSDEWLELHNTTKNEIDLTGWKLVSADGSPNITLSGVIPPLSFYLLERTNDKPVNDIPADWKGTFGQGGLKNTGEELELRDAQNNLIDKVGCQKDAQNDCIGWFAGIASPDYISMERVNPRALREDSNNWANNNGITRNGLDANDNQINGTPRAQNSVYQTLPPDAIADLALDLQNSYSNTGVLTWSTSTDPDTASEDLSYAIYYSKEGELTENNLDGETIQTATTTQTIITVSDLDYNSAYYFGVKVFDPQNNSSRLATTTPYKTATLGVIASDFPSNFNIDNNGRKLVRASKGDLYAVYHRDNKVYLAKSQDNGLNWIEAEIVSGQYQINPSIAIDSQDNLHIVWQVKVGTSTVYKIRYTGYDGNSFSAIEDFTADESKSQEIPVITVDSQNKIHIAWVGKNNPGDRIYYTTNSAGALGDSIEIVKDLEFSGGLWSSIAQFSFTSDSQGVLHFVWFEGVPIGGCCVTAYLRYRNGNFGVWSAIKNLAIVDLQNYSSIAFDSQDNIHIVWHQPAQVSGEWRSLIKYLKCAGDCASGGIETLSDEKNPQTIAFPSISADSDDNIYIAWKRHTLNPLQQIEYKNGAWQDVKELTAPFEQQGFPNLFYQANRPKTGYAFVFYEGTELKFYGSEDLTPTPN